MKFVYRFCLSIYLLTIVHTVCGQSIPTIPSKKPASGTQNTAKATASKPAVAKPKTFYINGVAAVTIGRQTWMQKNLDVDRFRNGDPIPEARSEEEWKRSVKEGKPAWCYYENDPANGSKYGKLYNWYAVTDPRGLAPEGWVIPTVNDWDILTKFLGEGYFACVKRMKSNTGWYNNSNGSNSSGFSGLPGGCRLSGSANFAKQEKTGYWWSSSAEDREKAWLHMMDWIDSEGFRFYSTKGDGFSVRCLKE